MARGLTCSVLLCLVYLAVTQPKRVTRPQESIAKFSADLRHPLIAGATDEDTVIDPADLDKDLECNWQEMMDIQVNVSLIDRLLMSHYIESAMIELAELCVLKDMCEDLSLLKASMPINAIQFAMDDCAQAKIWTNGVPSTNNRLCWGELELESLKFGALHKEHKVLHNARITPAIALCLPEKCSEEKLMEVQKSMVQIFNDVVENVERKKYILEKSGLKFTNWNCTVDHSSVHAETVYVKTPVPVPVPVPVPKPVPVQPENQDEVAANSEAEKAKDSSSSGVSPVLTGVLITLGVAVGVAIGFFVGRTFAIQPQQATSPMVEMSQRSGGSRSA